MLNTQHPYYFTMLNAIPRYYHDASIADNIMYVEAEEFFKLNDERKEVLDQFFVDTATWGLNNWERVCGLEINTNLSIEERRSVIKSKLRGFGTVNIQLIKKVVEPYAGEIEVEDAADRYTIVITFVGERGTPVQLENMKASLLDIIPAHLAMEFVFTYLTWDELDNYLWTWDELDQKDITWKEFEIYRKG
ncbi:putative phage tail protein [Longirhabdus pacifica]|uniref:putative phage tail protein n=1 Tax=Longirhabdus pacifica TaxID=2305227 RepID=UPI001009323F|nr:putative phage tail protein [Longirhabdus pacifica]